MKGFLVVRRLRNPEFMFMGPLSVKAALIITGQELHFAESLPK
jgi:hypothetical protein